MDFSLLPKEELSDELIPVLCCCTPSNQIGMAPKNLPLPTRTFVDADGNEGLAFPSNTICGRKCCPTWSQVPGFVATPEEKQMGKKKTWKKEGKKGSGKKKKGPKRK